MIEISSSSEDDDVLGFVGVESLSTAIEPHSTSPAISTTTDICDSLECASSTRRDSPTPSQRSGTSGSPSLPDASNTPSSCSPPSSIALQLTPPMLDHQTAVESKETQQVVCKSDENDDGLSGELDSNSPSATRHRHKRRKRKARGTSHKSSGSEENHHHHHHRRRHSKKEKSSGKRRGFQHQRGGLSFVLPNAKPTRASRGGGGGDGPRRSLDEAENLDASSFLGTCTSSSLPSSHSLWVDKYHPQSASEIPLTKLKVDEARTWLQSALRSAAPHNASHTRPPRPRARLLRICGPSGCGKTALLRVLAKELNCELEEYTSPTDTSHRNVHSVRTLPYESQMAHFQRFLHGARYPSLFHHNPYRKIILVEDLPCVHDDRDGENQRQLGRILLEAADTCVFPIVLIHGTDAPPLHRDALESPSVHTITIKSGVPRTRMKAVLKRIAQKEGYRVDNVQLDTIASGDASGGDLRNAINALQLFCTGCAAAQNGHTSKSPSSSTTTTKKKKKKKSRSSSSNRSKRRSSSMVCPQGDLSSAGSRDVGVALFHAVGKVLWGKRIPPCETSADNDEGVTLGGGKEPMVLAGDSASTDSQCKEQGRGGGGALSPADGILGERSVLIPKWNKHIEKQHALPPIKSAYRRDPLKERCIEEVIESTDVLPRVFNNFLHEHYLGFAHSNHIEEAAQASTYFSDADALHCWKERRVFDGYASSLASRGVMYSLAPHLSPPRGFHSLAGQPQQSKVRWTAMETRREMTEEFIMDSSSSPIGDKRLAEPGMALLTTATALQTEIIPYLGCMARHSPSFPSLRPKQSSLVRKLSSYQGRPASIGRCSKRRADESKSKRTVWEIPAPNGRTQKRETHTRTPVAPLKRSGSNPSWWKRDPSVARGKARQHHSRGVSSAGSRPATDHRFVDRSKLLARPPKIVCEQGKSS